MCVADRSVQALERVQRAAAESEEAEDVAGVVARMEHVVVDPGTLLAHCLGVAREDVERDWNAE